MIRISFIVIIFYCKIVNSQIANDTVDYSTITHDLNYRQTYMVDKVTSGPKSDAMNISFTPSRWGTTLIRLYSDSKTSYKETFSCFKNNANYNILDTLIYLEFDMEKFDKPFKGHQWGIIHFHKNNIITIDKVRDGGYMRREFKVLKWTNTEIILKDNSFKSLNRTYYLRKRYK